MCWNLFLIQFIKKKLQHRCFPVNIAKFLRTTFFIEHLRWLLLYLFLACGSSRLVVFYKKGVLRNFAKFKGKYKKEKKRLWHRHFLEKFAKFIRTPFLIEYLQWLLLCMPYPILSYPLATSNRVPPPSFSNRKHYRN